MKIITKIFNNILSLKMVKVIGVRFYIIYLMMLFLYIRRIFQTRNLQFIDKAMGSKVKRFRYRGSVVLFDCEFCDNMLNENSYGFGIVREIFVRDCYFKWLPAKVYENAKKVIDMGANRGAFSALMTPHADFILSVECKEVYVPIIRHNMNINNFSNYHIETAFIGGRGAFSGIDVSMKTIDELFDCYKVNVVDFLKIDIEGSEFDLFKSGEWLQRVKAISMEVHPEYGDPSIILEVLQQNGFVCRIADEDLRLIKGIKDANYIYAWKEE